MESENEEDDVVSYKQKYRQLKSRLKYLVYVSTGPARVKSAEGLVATAAEICALTGLVSPSTQPQEHECFENDIQKAQTKLLQLSRDKR